MQLFLLFVKYCLDEFLNILSFRDILYRYLGLEHDFDILLHLNITMHDLNCEGYLI